MAMVESLKFDSKQKALKHLARSLDVDLTTLVDSYKNLNFSNSKLSKFHIFSKVLAEELDFESKQFLAERCALPFHRDNRNSVSYGIELVIGWLAEDILVAKLSSMGLTIGLSGNDRQREFLDADKIDTSSDFGISVKGSREAKVELVISWNGYWSKSKKLDLRDSKFRHLTRASTPTILLGFEPSTDSYFCFNIAEIKPQFIWRENPAWGNKGVYTLNSIDTHLRNIKELDTEKELFVS